MGKHVNARRGEGHHNARLNERDVRQMRNLHYNVGLCIKCISTLYEVRYATAWEAITYQTWKHVTEDTE